MIIADFRNDVSEFLPDHPEIKFHLPIFFDHMCKNRSLRRNKSTHKTARFCLFYFISAHCKITTKKLKIN